MTIHEYLDRFPYESIITVVGPFNTESSLHEPIIFVDSGSAARLSGEGIAIGDGDSSSNRMDVLLDCNKSYSDLSFALESIPARFTHVHLLGFLGGHRDHEYFNIGCAHRFLENRASPSCIWFDDRICGYSPGKWTFSRFGTFSIAAIQDTWLTLGGDCAFPCKTRTRFHALSSLGLSNVGTGSVVLENEGPVFVLFEDRS